MLSVGRLLLAASAVLLAGCAGFSADGGAAGVSRLTRERIGQDVRLDRGPDEGRAMRALVDEILRQALSPDDAVRVALLNNKGLQADLAELGVAEADLVQAGRMRNPGISFGRLRAGADVEIERAVTLDLVGLLTIPLRTRIERDRLERARTRAALRAVELATQARKAWFTAVAAAQNAAYMEQAAQAADAGAELSRRMAAAGNLSKLDQARESAFHAETMAQVALARRDAVAARERLTRLLGLAGTQTAYTLPERMPDVPKEKLADGDLQARAMAQRLDVAAARADAAATARALGLTRVTGVIDAVEYTYANRSETGAPRANGYEIALELPLFDWGGARTAKAQALYMQAVHRAADTAVRAQSEVRERTAAYHGAWEAARRYQDEIVPLRKRISEEVLLRYNGMLVGVFELLADARAQIASVNAAIAAQRDFWLAYTDLRFAVTGGSPVDAAPAAAAGPATPSAGH